LLFGCIKNFDFTPYLIDAANLVYKINDFALDASLNSSEDVDVRDGGLSLKTTGLFSFDNTSMSANIATETLSYTAPTNLGVDDVIIFRQVAAGALFTGLASNTQYWVIAAGLTPNDFRLSLTRGGAAVNITGAVLTGAWRVERRRFYIDAAAATISLSSLPAYRATMDFNVLDAAGEMINQGRTRRSSTCLSTTRSSRRPSTTRRPSMRSSRPTSGSCAVRFRS
jgi:hypothetical protein